MTNSNLLWFSLLLHFSGSKHSFEHDPKPKMSKFLGSILEPTVSLLSNLRANEVEGRELTSTQRVK